MNGTSSHFDIAIIGGGVIGVSLARRLAGEGRRVVLIDAGPAIPPATRAAAGMLAPSFEEGLGGEALYALSVDSLRQWPDFAAGLEAETGFDIDFRSDGILGVALDDEAAAELESDFNDLKNRGANVRVLSGAAAQALEPALSPEVVIAMEAPDDAQVDPRKLLAALAASAERRGVFCLRARATSAERASGEWIVHCESGSTLHADALVLASGAASAIDIEGLPPPPVFPVKGDALALAMSGPATIKRVVRGPGAYLCPKAEGRVVLGATEAPEHEDLTPDKAALAGLRARAGAVAPVSATWVELERWAGLRPATPDGAPILGPDPRGPEQLYLALGHHRNGVLLTPASAERLAAAIIDPDRLEAFEPFRPDRFG